jgi:hypothetical protein
MSSHHRVLQILLARVAVALVLTASLITAACGADTAKFPPYPDEWEWFVPSDGRTHLTDLRAFLLDDGEVLVRAEFLDHVGKSNNRSWLLFSKRPVNGASIDEAGRVTAGRAALGQVVGTGKAEASIGSGFSVTNVSRAYRLCFRGPVRNIVVKRDTSGHIVTSRVVFVVLDQAREFVGGGGQAWLGEEDASCPDEEPVRVRYRVAAAAGTFLSLFDGTTLMVDRDAGMIVRLRDTLEPGRPSPSGRVYSFEYRDNDFFIDDVLGKHYSGDGEVPQYQEMLDDLYNYLTQQTQKR